LPRFTVFALGIMPLYFGFRSSCSACIDRFAATRGVEERGRVRRRNTQYTRYFTVALALAPRRSVSHRARSAPGLVIDPGLGFRFVTIVTL
jgi:preprotein translocase subunit SecY